MDTLKMLTKKKKKKESLAFTHIMFPDGGGQLNLLYIRVSVTTCDRAALRNDAQWRLKESCFEVCASSLSRRLPVSK